MATVAMPPAKPNIIQEFLRITIPLLILGAGIGFFWISGSLKKTAKAPPPDTRAPRVVTAEVTGYQGDLQIDVDGTVVPFREMTLTSEVAGRIKSRSPLCESGRFVPQGTILLEVDAEDYELEVERLQHELRQSEIAVQEVDVQVENLRSLAKLAEEDQGLQSREVQRLRRLVRDQAIAQSDLDRAQSTEVLSRNSVQRLTNEARMLVAKRAATNAAIDLAKTRLAQARLNLSRTKITAPVDGVVVRDLVEENDFVQRGTAVVEFEDTSAVEVKCNLMSEEVAWLSRSKDSQSESTSFYEPPHVAATIIYERSGHEFEWDGILSRYDGIGMDEKTRMVPCRFLVKNPNAGRVRNSAVGASARGDERAPRLVRGMFVNVIMKVPTARRLIEIPLTAVQLGDQIWRVVDEQLEIIPINVARRTRDTAIVVLENLPESLQIGDPIVVSPLAIVYDGMSVQVADAPALEPADRIDGDPPIVKENTP